LVTESNTILWHLVQSLGKSEAERITEIARAAKKFHGKRARLKSLNGNDFELLDEDQISSAIRPATVVEEKEAFLKKNFVSEKS
jgi:hypothetical protein